MKVKESMGNPDVISKLEAAEAKLQELKSNMAVLGKEAAAAMAAVEAQQQRLTLQRLIAMVTTVFVIDTDIIRCKFMLVHPQYDLQWHDNLSLKVEAERTYHQKIVQILNQLEGEVHTFVMFAIMTTMAVAAKLCIFLYNFKWFYLFI